MFEIQAEKFRQWMIVRNFSPSTIRSYKSVIIRVYNYFDVSLDRLKEHELIAFICYLKEEKGLSRESIRIAVAAIKYFYKYVINRVALVEKIPFPKKEKRIPLILSWSEVNRLFNSCTNLKHRFLLKLIYSAGLRRSEVINLSPADFDWDNLQIIVRQGKGKKDRYTVLAKSLEKDFLLYINEFQPEQYLFYGMDKSTPISTSLPRWAMDKAVERAGIKKKVHLHSLRHSFASHLISMHIDILTVQKLLGHNDIRTTMSYLHLNHYSNNRPCSPLDNIFKYAK